MNMYEAARRLFNANLPKFCGHCGRPMVLDVTRDTGRPASLWWQCPKWLSLWAMTTGAAHDSIPLAHDPGKPKPDPKFDPYSGDPL